MPFVRRRTIDVERAQRRDEPRSDADDRQGQDPAADHARDGAEQSRGDAALERAELIRRADEHPVDRRDAAADPLG